MMNDSGVTFPNEYVFHVMALNEAFRTIFRTLLSTTTRARFVKVTPLSSIITFHSLNMSKIEVGFESSSLAHGHHLGMVL